MITLVSYIDQEPLALDEVKQQCRIDGDSENDAFISSVIIPGARALAEQRTGTIIRKGSFTESILAGDALSVGGVVSVDSVKIDGAEVAFEVIQKGRRTAVQCDGNEGKTAVVTFTAGIDISKFPSVKSWLLLACGWLYENREAVSSGPNGFSEMPKGYVDALLAPIEVPSPF